MKYLGTHIVKWSEEDQAYIAETPELPGCKAEGDNVSIALTNLHAVMCVWQETAKDCGREIPELWVDETAEELNEQFLERIKSIPPEVLAKATAVAGEFIRHALRRRPLVAVDDALVDDGTPPKCKPPPGRRETRYRTTKRMISTLITLRRMTGPGIKSQAQKSSPGDGAEDNQRDDEA